MSVELAVWLGLAIILGLIEILTVGFFFLFFAAGALIAAIATFFTDNLVLQALVFVLASFALVIFARPILRNTLKMSDKPQPSNVSAVLNAEVLVLEALDQYKGKVKVIHTGEIWTAYLADAAPEETLKEGCPGIVSRIDGAKLAVRPKPIS